MNQQYQPGLHILLTVRNVAAPRLSDLSAWMDLISVQIKLYGLHSLGHVQHSFEGFGGYTAVHCLTESHISIHTWPEFGLCTCDIFLSNYKNDNRNTVKEITAEIVRFFNSETFDLKEVER